MSEAAKNVKKSNQKPESFSPAIPKILSMVEKEQKSVVKMTKTETNTRAKSTMKNALDFNVQFSNLMGRSFSNCFAGVYVYLENIFDELPKKCGGKQQFCFGCGCSRDIQSTYFVLFDTMCGKSSLYWRFDGAMTDMAALIGDNSSVGNWSGKCGTDYTIDFIFGFAGYEYRKITDATAFKDEITAAIDSDKPVLAELATDFCVITGYAEDMFTSSYYYTDQGNNTQEKQTVTLSCDEIKTIYVVGNKTPQRYTLKDGLERIKRVIESSFDENIWDNGIAWINATFINSTDDEFSEMSADELGELEKNIKETFTNQFNCHIFEAAFKHLPKVYDIEQYPELTDLCGKLGACIAVSSKYAFNRGNVLGVGLHRSDFGKKLISAIEDIKKSHVKMLQIIDQAIDLLSMTKEQLDEYRVGWEAAKRQAKAEMMLLSKQKLEEFDKVFSSEKMVSIDLTTMETKNWVKAAYSDELMVLTNEGSDRGRAHTLQEFSVPVKIDLRVKLSEPRLEILYHRGSLRFTQEDGKSELRIIDVENKEVNKYENIGNLPTNEFVDIEWILAKDFMAVRVNGEVRDFDTSSAYIAALKENPNFNFSSPISVCCYRDEMVIVELLRVNSLYN